MYEKTPLYIAAEYGDLEIVQALLAKRGIDVNAANIYSETPLMLASFRGHLDVVEALLAAPGINVNAANVSDYTSLHDAARAGRNEVVRVLLAAPGINVNATTIRGETPLHLVAKTDFHRLVGLYHADPAAEKGHREIVRALLEDPRLDLTARKKDGTPLYADVLTEYSDLYREIRKNVAYNRRSPAIVAWKRIRSRRRPVPASASASAPASAPASSGGKQHTRKVYKRKKI
jgi:ankyrin repeat protein